jgi:hypothetical protein
VLSACGFGGASQTRPSPSFASRSGATATGRAGGGRASVVSVVKHAIEKSGPGYSVKLEYPQIEYPSRPRVAEPLNAALLRGALAIVSDFNSEISDLLEPDPARPSTLEGGFSTVRLDARVASFRTTVSTYVSRAAHPGETVYTYNLDLETGKELGLGDLFKPGAPYLERLSEACRRIVRDNYAAISRGEKLTGTAAAQIDQGTSPKAQSFAAWALGPNGLEITFQEHQVGPGVLGTVECAVAREELAGLALPGGPL